MPELSMAVIGLKGVGSGHVRNIAGHPRARLAAVADIDADTAGRVAREYRAQPYTDYRRMLDQERLDAVVIATPHLFHAPMTLDALAAGAHVLVEKPLAMRVSEGDRMVEAARSRKRVLAVGHNYRTFPGNLRLKALLDSGVLGAVYRVLWQWIENRPEAYYRRDIWRCTWKHAGGGVLMNQTSHDLDLLCWLLGPPAEVSAMICNQAHQHEVEDTAVASIRFAGGALANVQFSTCGHSLNYRQIWGERGMMVFQHEEQDANVAVPQRFRLGLYRESLRETIQTDTRVTGQPAVTWQEVDCAGATAPALLDRFIAAALDGDTPVADGASALHTLELINAIILSGVCKKVVACPVDRAEYDGVLDALIRGEAKVERWG